MLFLVTCVYADGVEAASFRIVEASSRLEVAGSIVESPDIWSRFLHDAHLYDPMIRGNQPYYVDPLPVTAGEALRLIDRSTVDGDNRARMSIHPIPDILALPLLEKQPDLSLTGLNGIGKGGPEEGAEDQDSKLYRRSSV